VARKQLRWLVSCFPAEILACALKPCGKHSFSDASSLRRIQLRTPPQRQQPQQQQQQQQQ